MNIYVLIAFVVGVITALLAFIVVQRMIRWHSDRKQPLPVKPLQGELSSPAGTGEVIVASETDVEAPEPAQTLTIRHSDNSVPDLVFERDVSFHLGKQPTNITGSGFNSIVPAVVTDSLVASGVIGTFRATADPMTLMRYAADGSYSAMVKGSGGGIAMHKGFVPTDAVQVFTPIVVYQVLSIVTGQYYLHGIAKQLNDISAKLDKLIKYHHNERVAKLRAFCHTLQGLLDRNSVMIEDATIVQMMLVDIDAIEQEYTSNLLDINESRYHDAMNEGFGSSKPMLKMLEGFLSNDSPVTYAEMIVLARRTRTLGRLTELKVNVMLSRQDSERVGRSRTQLERMMTARLSDRKDDEALSKAMRVLGEASSVAEKIKEQAVREGSKQWAKEISVSVSKQMRSIDDSFDEARKEILLVAKNLKQRMEKKQEVVLVSGADGVRLLTPSQGTTVNMGMAD